MPRFLEWLLGIKSTPDWEGGSWRVEFQSLPEGLLAALSVAGGIACLVGIVYLYRKEGREIGPIARASLAGLRLFVLMAVCFMLFELVVVITKREQIPSHLLVLMDTSQSLDLSDPYPNEALAGAAARGVQLSTKDGRPDVDALRKTNRLKLAQRALSGVLPKLGQGRVVTSYAFTDKLQPLTGKKKLASQKPTGVATNVGDAISGALAAHRGQPMAGILLVTDGRTNAGEDPRKAAAQAAKDGVPIVSLAVGTVDGPRNASLVDIEASPIVFLRDPSEISVLVASRGLNDATASVTLEQRAPGGEWREVAREVITLGQDSVVKRTVFTFTPDAVGQIDFRAHVGDVGPELTEADNTDVVTIKVVRQTIRVLLIAGYPGPEVQFLRNTLLRDSALEFASWLQSAGEGYEHIGHRPVRRLPANQQELDHFDVVILFDPDMRQLGPAFPEMITKFVGEAGGGLIYVAGELNSQNLFSPDSAEGAAPGALDNSWIKILPVVRDPKLYQSAADVRLGSKDTYNMELTQEGAADPIFRFDADPSRNRDVFRSLPGMYWHFPVTRAKSGATVLARHGDPRMRNSFGRHVLLAMQLYGPGRSVFLGFDSTYRWRYLHEEYFDGFWARLIDRVGRSKVLGGRYPFTLATDKNVYRTGDRVTLRAQVIGSQQETAMLGELRGEVEFGGDATIPLTLEPVADEPGALEATFVATDPGAYTVRVVPTAVEGADASLRPATLNFRVEPPRQEYDNPTLDLPLLNDVARVTGGKVFTLANASSIPSAFKVREVERVLEFRDEVWDAPLLFGAVIILLTVEWLLRKKFRMA